MKGFDNTGTNCFINVCLRVLVNTPEIYFLEDAQDRNKTNDYYVFESFKDILREYKKHTNKIIDPSVFIKIIKRVAKGKGNKEFSCNKQNDASEFFMFLIKCIHDSISGPSMMVAKRPIAKSQAVVWDMINSQTKDYSELNDIFYGVLITEISKIKSLKVQSTKAEQFFILELPILEGDEISIYDCFDKLTEKELLEGENKWYNEKSRKKEDVILQTNFFRFPTILIVSLSRFSIETGRKINKIIKFPTDYLRLSSYCHNQGDKNATYELYAVCNHIGLTINSGHYNVFIKNNSNWFLCDDEYVTRANEKNVCSENSYLLFYRKI